MPGADPARRPMADLDLLVRPGDRVRLHEVLVGLGYRHVPDGHRRPTHDVFVEPGGGGRPVDLEGEHPDNPRRVEVHVEVKRHLWGWADDDDLTAELWRGASRGEILGRPATLPRPDEPVRPPRHPCLERPAERPRPAGPVAGSRSDGAGRRRPRQAAPSAAGLSVAPARPTRPPHRARWRGPGRPRAARAGPADALGRDRPPRRVVRADHRPPARRTRHGLGARWERWRPDRWRLLVAYGKAPLPVALARHGLTVAGRARRRR